MEEDRPSRQLSVIGRPLTSLQDLAALTDPATCTKAIIIHNNSLTSMAGISQLANLIDLNISCNRITVIEGLHNMRNLKKLNLSNNKITVINGLAGLYSLEYLDLSVNRIASLSNLAQLYGPQYPFFSYLSLKGNNISQLQELNYLKGCENLRELELCGQKETNAVCRLMEYQYTVLKAVPGLIYLDKTPVSRLTGLPKEPVSPPKQLPPDPIPPKPISKSPPKTHSDASVQFSVPPVIQREYQAELLRLQHENEQLMSDNRELLKKYDENDQYWTERCKRFDMENNEKKTIIDDLQRQILKLSKNLSSRESRLEIIENDYAKIVSLKDQREKNIDELHRKIAEMMKDLGESQKSAQNAIEDSYRFREKLDVAEKVAGELRAQLKLAEQTIAQIHGKSMENSNLAAQRVEETQRKWENAEIRAEQAERESEGLKSRVKELLELNDKLEQVWTGKVREAESTRDHALATLKFESAQIASQERERAQTSILHEKEQFLMLTKKLEDEWREKVVAEQEKCRELQGHISNLQREKTDLQQMLKMSVEKEAKSKGLIEELTELVRQMQESIENERRETIRVKAKAEEEVEKWKKLGEGCKTETDKVNRQLALLQGQAGEDETLLSERSREVIKLKREVQKLSQELEDLEDLRARSKSKWEKAEFAYTEEITSLQQRISDQDTKITTQTVLIDDQNETIRSLKGKIQLHEEELDMLHSQRDQGKSSLESKLRSAYDELEVIQKQLNNAENRIGELEEQLEILTNKRKSDKETIGKLNEELMDKAAAIDLIEREVMSLQEARKGEEAAAIAERNHIIEDLKRYRDELMTSLAAKDKEIKEKAGIMRSMQTHIETKELEVQKYQSKVSEMEGEIRLLLGENERLRSLRAEAARLLKA